MRITKGKEDPELPLLQRISSLALRASDIAAQINNSQSSSNTFFGNYMNPYVLFPYVSLLLYNVENSKNKNH
jgi:hypothetical protein